jgi:hypothetical protein
MLDIGRECWCRVVCLGMSNSTNPEMDVGRKERRMGY